MRVGLFILSLSCTTALQGVARPAALPRSLALQPARTSASPLMDFGGPRFKDDAVAGEVAEVPFEIRFSLGNLVSASGFALLVYCLASYLFNPEGDIVATFGFVYAIPALVGGLALKYAELPPVPVDTSPEAEAAREAKATTIQAKIFSDATRFTYGDAHMEDPLKALKLAPRGMGPPELKSIREFVSPQGGYGLGLTFFAPNTPYRVWKDRAPRYSRFFGPNVRAEIRKVSGERRLVELSLISCNEGEDDTPLEVIDEKGTLAPVQTAAEEEKKAIEAANAMSGFD